MRGFKQTPDVHEALAGLRDTAAQEVGGRMQWSHSISKDLAARVSSYAQRTSHSRSMIVTMALEEFLARHGG